MRERNGDSGMENKRVKDVMVPLDEYGVISQDATLLDAISAFEEALKRRDRRRQPFRAVLIVDENNKVVGKLGQLAFLKALEPNYTMLGDVSKLTRAGVSAEFINSMMAHYRFFQDSLSDLCRRAIHVRVKDVMHPVTECIDEDAFLGEAIYKMVTWQTLSILVKRGEKVVGLLRLSDLCQEVAGYMKNLAKLK
ncbi:MAG: CBS domain-containing protein [Candidatus Zixiibacteriota bacterium]|nr:MAG: CBS domain-containing protein [candidate division Zixibacteria bacterium]